MGVTWLKAGFARWNRQTGQVLPDTIFARWAERVEAALNPGAVSPTSTTGFGYLPTCVGTPTSVPTVPAGSVAVAYDTSADRLWFYTGGAWRSIAFSTTIMGAGGVAVYPLGSASGGFATGSGYLVPLHAARARVDAALWAGLPAKLVVQLQVFTAGATVTPRLRDYTTVSSGSPVAVSPALGAIDATDGLLVQSVAVTLISGLVDYGIEMQASTSEVEYEYAAYLQLGA